jgi:hypothetical protein
MTTREIKNIDRETYKRMNFYRTNIIHNTIWGFTRQMEDVRIMNPNYSYDEETNSIVLSVGEERVIDGFATTVLDNLEECILRELKLV